MNCILSRNLLAMQACRQPNCLSWLGAFSRRQHRDLAKHRERASLKEPVLSEILTSAQFSLYLDLNRYHVASALQRLLRPSAYTDTSPTELSRPMQLRFARLSRLQVMVNESRTRSELRATGKALSKIETTLTNFESQL